MPLPKKRKKLSPLFVGHLNKCNRGELMDFAEPLPGTLVLLLATTLPTALLLLMQNSFYFCVSWIHSTPSKFGQAIEKVDPDYVRKHSFNGPSIKASTRRRNETKIESESLYFKFFSVLVYSMYREVRFCFVDDQSAFRVSH